MKKQTSWMLGSIVAVTTAITLLAGTGRVAAQEWVDAPEDQAVLENENATFTAEPKFGDLSFQWLRQRPEGYDLLKGETRSSLTLSRVGIGDVGFYLCAVMQGAEIQFTRAASLTVGVASGTRSFTKQTSATQSFSTQDYGGETLTLFGPPVVSGGSQGACPGTFAGYVNYTKTVAQGWGWAPSTNTTVHTASDDTRTDTKVQYLGKFGDKGCELTAVTVPHPNSSPKYRFTIYFPDNVPSTNAYPITLAGFDP